MKLGLTIASWFLLLLSIGLFITAFCFFWKYIEYVIIGGKDYKTIVGTVTRSESTITTSSNNSTGTSYVENKSVEIGFTDEEGTRFKLTIHPVFFNLKEGKKIKVKYRNGKSEKYLAKRHKEKNVDRPIYASGAPTNIWYSLERPILFALAAFASFILRIVPLAMKNSSIIIQ